MFCGAWTQKELNYLKAVLPDTILLLPHVCCCRYGHLLASFVLLGREDVSERSHHINLDTMVAGEVEATAQQQARLVAQLMPALQLSEQQQELIAVGTHLHYVLVAAVHQERKELDVQMTATLLEGSSLSMSTSVDPASSAGSRAGSGDTTDQMQSIQHRRSVLDRQQQLAARLALLLHKEVRAGWVGRGGSAGLA